ncbi:hypothetical protein [Loigolactobacillus jiayinensis]|uniref:Holin n=1 Tax=Loigolactobacillus jiayinensis TaxID=2486016 RepID=A0ABW1RCV9_9LACO|nr:hypothetical protein [Loigolactobacillus jiayinensis]
MKINFNVKSTKAWAALGSAVIGAVVSVLAALGIVIKPTDATTLYSTVTAVLSLLAAAGILTDTNKPAGDDKED